MATEVEQSGATPGTSSKSLGDLFSDFARQTSTLVRQEVELGKTELVDSAKQVGRHGALVAGGGVLTHVGVLALVAAIIVGLGQTMPYAASALIVGVVLVAVGLAASFYGRTRLKRVDLTPRRTIENVKYTAATARDSQQWTQERH